MTWVNRVLITPASQADLARTLCATLAGPAGDGMFNTPLSSDGTFPATHYISSGLIEDTFAGLLPLTTFDAEGVATTAPGQPETIVYLAGEAGMVVTLADVQGLLDAIVSSAEDPHEAMARLGLMMCSEPEGAQP